jgi:hypothetical protein
MQSKLAGKRLSAEYFLDEVAEHISRRAAATTCSR